MYKQDNKDTGIPGSVFTLSFHGIAVSRGGSGEDTEGDERAVCLGAEGAGRIPSFCV